MIEFELRIQKTSWSNEMMFNKSNKREINK